MHTCIHSDALRSRLSYMWITNQHVIHFEGESNNEGSIRQVIKQYLSTKTVSDDVTQLLSVLSITASVT